MTDDIRHRMVEILPRLRRFAYALTGDLDKGDDLVQEACVRALANLDQWQQGTRLDSWMYRIAQNIWYDRARAQKVRGVAVDIDTALDLTGSDGRHVAESRSDLARVRVAMARLPQEQRALIALVCVEGLSYKEAAAQLDIPIGTVMSRLARARAALHATIEVEKPVTTSDPQEGRRGRVVR